MQWLSPEKSFVSDGGSTAASMALETSVAAEVMAPCRIAFQDWKHAACRAIEQRRAVAALLQAEQLLFQLGYLHAWHQSIVRVERDQQGNVVNHDRNGEVYAWLCPRIEGSPVSPNSPGSCRSNARGPFLFQGSQSEQHPHHRRTLLRNVWNQWRVWLNKQQILRLTSYTSQPLRSCGRSSATVPASALHAAQPRSFSCTTLAGRRLPWERKCQQVAVRSSTPSIGGRRSRRRGLPAGACRGRNVLPHSTIESPRQFIGDCVGTTKLSTMARCRFQSGPSPTANTAAEPREEACQIWDEFMERLARN